MTILDQSLCMMSGVSYEAECRLCRQGVLSCRQLATDADKYFSKTHAGRIRESFEEWEIAKANDMTDWMVTHLPVGHRIRVLKEYWQQAMFYDIETDGTSSSSSITCITTIRNGVTHSFWRGYNLAKFLSDWAKVKVLVSFNGKRFDTPMVCKAFGLTAIPAQIDLMDELAHYGYRGGLKNIEMSLGFQRNADSCKNGSDAIKLWDAYLRGHSKAALFALLKYNKEDVESLVFLAKTLLKLSLQNTLIIDN